MRLSVCIATYNRAGFIGQTLESIAPQLTDEMELVVVDGASTDGTAEVMAEFLVRHPRTVYRREICNSGVDRDFDKAVEYASGDYCWLMSDDDILVPDALSTVLAHLGSGREVIVVNAEVRSKDLSVVLKPRLLEVTADREFDGQDQEEFFAISGNYLSFIGAVVIRRATWLARDRGPYFGSLFVHMGVIFQQPAIGRALILERPLIRIRYGNAMWSARGFEIWIEKWPRLVWSFDHFSTRARARVAPRHPARSAKTLLLYRGIGAYGQAEYDALLAGGKLPHHFLARAVAVTPARAVNAAIALYCLIRRQADASMMVHDLVRASCVAELTRWIARRFRFPEMER
jgi:glycosyltransferase involved in cell wall biosynthesis